MAFMLTISTVIIICLSWTTHYCPTIPNETVKNILSKWSINYRYDAPDPKPHIGIICLIPKINPKANEITKPVYIFLKDQLKFKFDVTSSENMHSALFIVGPHPTQTNVNLLEKN